jgi:hypothetical protein
MLFWRYNPAATDVCVPIARLAECIIEAKVHRDEAHLRPRRSLPGQSKVLSACQFKPGRTVLRAAQRTGREVSQRTETLRADDRPDDVHIHLAAKFVGRELQHRPRYRNAGIVDEATERLAAQRRARTSRAAASTAVSSVTSNISCVTLAPNSLLRRSTSTSLRTLSNTRNPRSS